ncbi:MAG: glycosyltransferase family 2 protein [Anaerolineae bacterium]|nr:glycosyltransferase family 2 protein [Anaerolineae bacterium]
MKISFIVCVYNEKDTVLAVLERLRTVDLGAWEREIVVVDNCSSDGTRELLRQVDMPGVQIVYHPYNMGKGSSIRTALTHVTGDYAVIHDADLEYDPDDHPKLLALVEQGAVAVFGSRTLGGRAVYEYVHAYWGIRFLTALCNFLFGGELTDTGTAIKLVRTDVFKALNLIGNGFDLDFELPAKLLKAGVKIYEAPINYRPRTYEQGKKITVWDGLHSIWVMFRERLGLTPLWKQNTPPVLEGLPSVESRPQS